MTVSNNSFIMPEGNVTVNATFKAVAAAPVAHSITVSQTTNGTVTPFVMSAVKDTEITLTVTPASGYEIDTLTVNGTAVTGNTFTMPDEDVTVAATFVRGYTLSIEWAFVASTDPQQISPSFDDYANYVTIYDRNNNVVSNGSSIGVGAPVKLVFDNAQFDEDKNGSYSINHLCVVYGEDPLNDPNSPDLSDEAGKVTTNGNTITFNMPKGNTSIIAELNASIRKKISYSFIRGNSLGGESSVEGITVSGPTSAEAGASVQISVSSDEFTITGVACSTDPYFNPKTGYSTQPVEVTMKNGTFTMPDENVVVKISFTGTGYPAYANDALGGTINITPATSNYISNIAEGDIVTVTGNPEANFVLDDIEVTAGYINVPVTQVANGFRFTMPDSEVEITPTFVVSGTDVTISQKASISIDDINRLLNMSGVSTLVLSEDADDNEIFPGYSRPVSIPAGKTLELGSGVELYVSTWEEFANAGTLIIDEGASFISNNNPKIYNNGMIINNGTLKNKGDSSYTGSPRLYNYGTITNNGTYLYAETDKDGVVVNYGTINGTNSGDILVKSPTDVYVTDEHEGHWTLTYGGTLTVSTNSGYWWGWNGGGASKYGSDVITVYVQDVNFYEKMFYNCKNMTSVTFSGSGENITGIGSQAFYGCSSLPSIVLPGSVQRIGASAFFGCTALTTITIPATLTSIGENAINNCTSLTHVYFTGTESQWNHISKGTGNDVLSSSSVTIHFN